MNAYKIPQRMLRPIGRCIYCTSDKLPLSREHIFPFSIGGTLVLPKASCVPCAKITRDFEQTIGRSMLGKVRLLFNLPTQHKDQRPSELPLDIEVAGKHQTIMVSISDYPSVPVIFPVFQLPGILRGEPPTDIFRKASSLPVLPNIEDNEARLQRLRAKFGGPLKIKIEAQTHIGSFVRMLAKIAHANAVAEFGLGSFSSFLPDIILGSNPNTPFYIGCIEADQYVEKLKAADGTHQLRFGLSETFDRLDKGESTTISRQKFLVAVIQLFKGFGSPMYIVVIGIPSPEIERILEDNPL